MTGNWRDDPAVRAAVDHAKTMLAIIGLPAPLADAELAARGLHPVAVAYGELDTPEAAELVYGRLAAAAETAGCRSKAGGHDYTVYLFPDGPAAAGFIAEVTGWPPPTWWTITASATPTFRGGLPW